MRTMAALILVGLAASPALAQDRGRAARAQGIPPGHLPPAGLCRVWYDGVPPGRQPAATNCREAERRAARDRGARVIYGASRDDDRRGLSSWSEAVIDRAEEARRRDGARYPASADRLPFDHGYRDGLAKGREDARDRDSFDPVRHRWYRNGDRGYTNRYGSRDRYKLVYRDGFEAGYRDGYRSARR